MTTQKLIQSFNFDFLTASFDSAGNWFTGVQLPIGAKIITLSNWIISDLTSTTNIATISFGTILSPTLLISLTAVTNFILPNVVVYNIVTGVDTATIMDNTLDLIMQVASEPLTAGKFEGIIEYYYPE